MYEAWQRVKLPLDLQSIVIWYKSDEPFLYITSNTRICLINLAVSCGRANFLKNGWLDLYEAWQRVKLPAVQKYRVIWYKSDEPFFYNHIKHKEMSNKSGSVTLRANFLENGLIDLYETWQRVDLPLDQQFSVMWYKSD